MKKKLQAKDYIEGILNKDRSILARTISLVESQKKSDMELADKVLEALSKYAEKSLRIGITGVPGAGKSTFINTLGSLFCEAGDKVAVLSIDPSSSISGGSILGDKTRMQDLAFHNNAYIRPSPSLGYLGGVAARTRETILICEAFGFNKIIIESVGVGQSEQEISTMVDLTIMLTLSGAGDDLQGIKRGLLETTDWILINKADSENKEIALRYLNELKSAYQILKGKNDLFIKAISSLDKEQVKLIAQEVNKIRIAPKKRRKQKEIWLNKLIEQRIMYQYLSNKDFQESLKKAKDSLSSKHPLMLIKDIIQDHNI